MKKSTVDLFHEIDWEAFCPNIHTKEQEQGSGEELSILLVAIRTSLEPVFQTTCALCLLMLGRYRLNT